MAIKGAALDTRLQHGLLLDPKLQRRLSGDEFRSFINLMVWSVSLVSDGVFDPEDADMIVPDRAHIDQLAKVGLIERCEASGLFRFSPDYWGWQTSKVELERMHAKRLRDAQRKRDERNQPAAPPNRDERGQPSTIEFEDEQPW